MEKYKRKVKCIMKGCPGIVEVNWNDKHGFKNTNCPICKTLFKPYIETRLRLIKVEKPIEAK